MAGVRIPAALVTAANDDELAMLVGSAVISGGILADYQQ